MRHSDTSESKDEYWRYFDLSQPVTFRDPESPSPSAPAAAQPPSSTQPLPLKWQIATYVILIFSIMASRFLDLYRVGNISGFHLDLPYLIFIAIASLLMFPLIYDKASFNRDKPVLLQIVLIFTAGMGWEKVISTTIGK